MRASPVDAISELCSAAYVAEQTATVGGRAGPLALAMNQVARRGADQVSSDDRRIPFFAELEYVAIGGASGELANAAGR
jgi:hypothetical protein